MITCGGTLKEEMDTFLLDSCVRGHHIYKDIWSPHVGETLLCQPEFGNIVDPYAVSIVTEDTVVGHVPRRISAVCHLFMRRGGQIVCQVTGARRYSIDLPQGGLEAPCSLMFIGVDKEVQKLKKLIDESASSNSTEPPNKKRKTSLGDPSVTIHVLDEDGTCNSESSVWLKIDGHMLTLSDEKDLLNNKMLNDHHINLAQGLLYKQFTNIEGLGHTLLQSRPPIKTISNGLQILFVRGNHWIVASTIDSDSNTVKVYDSLYSTLDEDTKKIILNLFEKSRSNMIHVNVQKQSGIKDCGLFAIAMSTALLFNIDVTAIYFHQLEMRHHLHACFKTGLMSPFPSSASPK